MSIRPDAHEHFGEPGRLCILCGMPEVHHSHGSIMCTCDACNIVRSGIATGKHREAHRIIGRFMSSKVFRIG